MADKWYSTKQRTRFSREHRELLPTQARMVDVDQVLWVPYEPYGHPVMLAEVKPEDAREDFWVVTCSLARMAGLAAAKIVELRNGAYRVSVANADNGWVPGLVGDLTMTEWYERVEVPLRAAVVKRIRG